jgi:branched-chain amino acid transport system substrate-binding protein
MNSDKDRRIIQRSSRGVFFALAFTGCALSPALAADKLKLGFVSTFSGPGGIYGQNMWDGFMLAVDEAGGKLGGLPVDISKNDDQLKPDVAKQIADKLVRRDNVDMVFGVFFSNMLMALYHPVVDSKTILITSQGGPSPLAGKDCSPYFFTTSWQNERPSAAVAQAMNEAGLKRVVVIVTNYEAGHDVVTGFKSSYKGSILSEILPAMGQPDYSTEIAQISALKPDAVFAFIASGPSINFVKQYNEAGLMKSTPLYSVLTITSTNLPAIGDIALGTKSANIWTADLDNPENKHFMEAFQAKYHYMPGINSANAYDATRLVDTAIREVNSKIEDKQAFLDALKRADFRSIRGNFRFNNNHFGIQNYYRTEIAKDEKGNLFESNRGVVLRDDQDPYHGQCSMK